MQNYFDFFLSLVQDWELKFSVSAIALFLSRRFGGGEWLLATIQYLVFIDLLLGIVSALASRRFDRLRFGKGISKITSVYFALLIVGVGTHAVDMATGGLAVFGVTGRTLYDLFVLYLISNELTSINRHLARFGFPANRRLEAMLTRFQSNIHKKLDTTLEGKIHDD